MVWLGIDLGEARIGVALSNPELSFAYPHGNIQVHGDSFHGLDAVTDIIFECSIDTVVVGLPLQLNGSEGKSAKKARRWVKALENRLEQDEDIDWDVRVMLRDERLTTVTAHHMLSAAQLNSRNHRAVVDQQSAVNILQSALDQAHNQRRECD